MNQLATENLVPYSKTDPSIFKTGQLTPVKDLKLLVRDYAVRQPSRSSCTALKFNTANRKECSHHSHQHNLGLRDLEKPGRRRCFPRDDPFANNRMSVILQLPSSTYECSNVRSLTSHRMHKSLMAMNCPCCWPIWPNLRRSSA